jgi:cystathionine beta-lyase
VVRGSTVLFEDTASLFMEREDDRYLSYGLGGSATHFALEDMIAAIEGGTRCQIVPSGLAAITLPLQAYLKAGDHLLIPDSVYFPTRRFCDHFLPRFGVTTTYYDPLADPAALAALFRPNTAVLFLESPGSHTFEVQDVPALAALGHAKGATVMLDNTWGLHHFQPFAHGVDISIQALTKYAGGHSDVLLGSVTVATEAAWKRINTNYRQLGLFASADDCWLALRGLRTLKLRLKAQEAAGIEVAAWFRARPEVLEVLHPALPGARGHTIWKRDFTGACSLFGVVFKPEYTVEDTVALIDALALFGIGFSWGGFESLILPTDKEIKRTAGTGKFGGPAVRLHIGLEDTADLIADLEHGLAVMRANAAARGAGASVARR